jgi:hypothetical protein
MSAVLEAPITGLPCTGAPTTVPNAISFDPDGWISTPLVRRPSNPLSRRTKSLIAVGLAALPACYFMFEESDGSIELAVAPRTTVAMPIEFLPSREAQAHAATEANVEIEPDVQRTPLQATAPLDGKSAANGIEARPLHTLPARGRSIATSERDSSCFSSASAVRLEHPGGWPSWTLRAPGHEGERCWYVATRTTVHDHRSEMRRTETAQTTERVEFPVLLGLY